MAKAQTDNATPSDLETQLTAALNNDHAKALLAVADIVSHDTPRTYAEIVTAMTEARDGCPVASRQQIANLVSVLNSGVSHHAAAQRALVSGASSSGLLGAVERIKAVAAAMATPVGQALAALGRITSGEAPVTWRQIVDAYGEAAAVGAGDGQAFGDINMVLVRAPELLDGALGTLITEASAPVASPTLQ